MNKSQRKIQETLEKRKSMAFTLDRIIINPFEIMQTIERAEDVLNQMKPGTYYVCINYKKKGFVEIRKKVSVRNSLKVCGTAEREDSQTKASLRRFATAVRGLYEQNIDIIGRTHAVKSFGQKMVDSIPHIKELKNLHYACAAPRRYYDRRTLLYLQLKEWEKASRD